MSEEAKEILSRSLVHQISQLQTERDELRAELAAEREMVAELKEWRKVVGDQLLAEIRNSTNLQAERDALLVQRNDAMAAVSRAVDMKIEAEAELDELREALEFYANDDGNLREGIEYRDNCGDRARTALNKGGADE